MFLVAKDVRCVCTSTMTLEEMWVYDYRRFFLFMDEAHVIPIE